MQKLTNYAMLHLTYFKHVLLNQQIKRNPKEIKPHLCSHFEHFWQSDGSATIWDTVSTEAAHKNKVKNVYRGSSKRRSQLLKELFNQHDSSRILREAKVCYEKAKGN